MTGIKTYSQWRYMRNKLIDGLDCVLCGKPAQTLHHPEEYIDKVEYYNAENQIPVCHWCHLCQLHPEKTLDTSYAENIQMKYIVKEPRCVDENKRLFEQYNKNRIKDFLKIRYEKGEMTKEIYDYWMKLCED